MQKVKNILPRIERLQRDKKVNEIISWLKEMFKLRDLRLELETFDGFLLFSSKKDEYFINILFKRNSSEFLVFVEDFNFNAYPILCFLSSCEKCPAKANCESYIYRRIREYHKNIAKLLAKIEELRKNKHLLDSFL